MRLSLASSFSGSLFSKIFGIVRGPRDPFIKNIHEAIIALDRMTSYIESTRKTLEDKYAEHQRRAKVFASEGKSDYERIFLEESKHISSLISMFSKIHHDLVRVRYRLETVTIVEEPMQLLPEVIQELEAIRPDIERLVPQLTSLLVEVERKVNNVMTASTLPSISRASPRAEASVDRELRAIPPLPPENRAVGEAQGSSDGSASVESVKRLLIEEIKRTGGVLVISDFSRRYGVARHVVQSALKKLQEEGLIRTK